MKKIAREPFTSPQPTTSPTPEVDSGEGETRGYGWWEDTAQPPWACGKERVRLVGRASQKVRGVGSAADQPAANRVANAREVVGG